MSTLKFIGLDGEMTGSDIGLGSALIQIGFAIKEDDELKMFYQTMNPVEMDWSEDAEKIHQISKSTVVSSPTNEQVDKMSFEWLLEKGLTLKNKSNQVAVGFNIGSFDMPFVKKYLPKTFSLFSRRTVDLNALCFALDGKVDPTNAKNDAKQYAFAKIGGIGLEEHNAGYDALLHMYVFEYLRNIMFDIDPEKG